MTTTLFRRAPRVLAALALVAAAGCAAYSWRPEIPADARTVAVPAFRNDSDITEFGDILTRQILREIQRDGVFRIAAPGEAAIEIQGSVANASSHTVAYERRTGARNREHAFSAVAKASFIDRRSSKVLADGRKYKGRTTFLSNDDVLTGERDASGRLAEDIARQIADDLLDLVSAPRGGAGKKEE